MNISYLMIGAFLFYRAVAGNIDNKAEEDYTKQYGVPASAFNVYLGQVNQQFIDYNVSLVYLQATKDEQHHDLFKLILKLSSQDGSKIFYGGFTILKADDDLNTDIILKSGYSDNKEDVLLLNGIKDYHVEGPQIVPEALSNNAKPPSTRLLEDILEKLAESQKKTLKPDETLTLGTIHDQASENHSDIGREVKEIIADINKQVLIAEVNDQMLVADINNQMFKNQDAPVAPKPDLPKDVTQTEVIQPKILEDDSAKIHVANDSLINQNLPQNLNESSPDDYEININSLVALSADELADLNKQVENSIIALEADKHTQDQSTFTAPSTPDEAQINLPSTNNIMVALNTNLSQPDSSSNTSQQELKTVVSRLLEDNYYYYY